MRPLRKKQRDSSFNPIGRRFKARASRMEFGVFDHLDRDDQPLGAYYESRLSIIEAYDRLGFYAYHIAEHHSTPLGMAPSPSVFLAAVAQRTRRLRFGPLVYRAAALSSAAADRGNLHARSDERRAARDRFRPRLLADRARLFRAGAGRRAGDLCRGARSGHQRTDAAEPQLPRQVLPLRRRADGA